MKKKVVISWDEIYDKTQELYKQLQTNRSVYLNKDYCCLWQCVHNASPRMGYLSVIIDSGT